MFEMKIAAKETRSEAKAWAVATRIKSKAEKLGNTIGESRALRWARDATCFPRHLSSLRLGRNSASELNVWRPQFQLSRQCSAGDVNDFASRCAKLTAAYGFGLITSGLSSASLCEFHLVESNGDEFVSIYPMHQHA